MRRQIRREAQEVGLKHTSYFTSWPAASKTGKDPNESEDMLQCSSMLS